MGLKLMKHPRNRSTAKVETKRLSLAPSKKRDTATVANSDVDDDFQEAKPKKPHFVVATPEDTEASKKPVQVKNTERSTMWAVRAFCSWVEEHNECSDEKCPIELLCMDDLGLLSKWLCVFVKEARRDNGEPYTPRSISMLLSGLQRFINSKREASEPLLNLIDPRNPPFRELHNVVEHRYRELHEQGVGAVRKQADIISREEEAALWQSGALGTHSPLVLLTHLLSSCHSCTLYV